MTADALAEFAEATLEILRALIAQQEQPHG